jgi:hypothetical protein
MAVGTRQKKGSRRKRMRRAKRDERKRCRNERHSMLK